MFGVKHHLVPGFRLPFPIWDLFGVSRTFLTAILVTSIATCCPALWAKDMLVPSPLPIFAIASLNASCSIEDGTESPFARPCRDGEFHRDDVASVLNRGHQYVRAVRPAPLPSRHKGFFGTTIFPACMGSSSRSFTACPVHQRFGLVVDAGGYHFYYRPTPFKP